MLTIHFHRSVDRSIGGGWTSDDAHAPFFILIARHTGHLGGAVVGAAYFLLGRGRF